MNYKRLEIYVGWTCNNKCTYCVEYPNMEESWNKKVTKFDILKKLIKYKKLGYNHVTFLGGEPFIQPVFFEALKIAKKLGYVILVTTNATTLGIIREAKKYLSYIDELILSVEAIDIDLQKKISRTNNYVKWDIVFENIENYWNGKMLKANIVVTKDNLNELFNLTKFLKTKNINNISITYPDLDIKYYGKKHLIDFVAPTYTKVIFEIIKIEEFCKNNNILLKIVDIPYCIFPEEKLTDFISITDDFDYGNRLKIDNEEKELDRKDLMNNAYSPRKREQGEKCKLCKYNNICWGYSSFYELLHGLGEIKTIK